MSAVEPESGFRVGIDLMSLEEVDEALAAHGSRYLRRVFTPHEQESCHSGDRLSTASLAARWAAKEATIKVLRPDGHIPAWTTMEVRRRDDGSCTLRLSGTAATLAQNANITSLSLSMTHEGAYAAAIVMARCDQGIPEPIPVLPSVPITTGFKPIRRKEGRDARRLPPL